MYSNKKGERNMSDFVDFYEIWTRLSFWQKARIYLHAMIQYRTLGIIMIICASFGAVIVTMFLFDNIYFSLVMGGILGALAARY